MKIEVILWADAGGDEDDHSWMDTDEVSDTNPLIKTVGWVIKETKMNLTVAMDLADDGTTHTRSRVPIGMIVSRVVLYDTEAAEPCAGFCTPQATLNG